MEVTFFSISDDQKLHFKSVLDFYDNTYEFQDKSSKDTIIRLKIIDSNHVIFERIGNIEMKMDLKKSIMTKGYYHGEFNLSLDFMVICKEILIDKNKIVVDYDYFIDEKLISTYKICLLIKQTP